MKNLFKILLSICAIVVIESCTNELSDEKENSIATENLEFENGILPDSFNFKVALTEDLFKEGVKINLSQDGVSFNEFLLQIDEIYEEYELDESLNEGINFKVENIEGNVIVSDLEIVTSNDSNFLIADCPKGMEKVKKCYSKDCVKDVLEKLGEKMEIGDSFSAHRQLTGVVLCASNRLKKAAYPTQEESSDEEGGVFIDEGDIDDDGKGGSWTF